MSIYSTEYMSYDRLHTILKGSRADFSFRRRYGFVFIAESANFLIFYDLMFEEFDKNFKLFNYNAEVRFFVEYLKNYIFFF